MKRLFLLLIISYFFSGMAFCQTEISTVSDLTSIANDLDGSYILTADITLSDSWTPIGSSSDPFTGVLNGDGHIISGLKFEDTSTASVGLFSYATGATIQNLGIEDANIVGAKDVAAFVGVMSGGTLEKCYVSNSFIQGTDHCASLVGQPKDDALVQNCYASAYVIATTASAGGLIGSAKGLTLKNCYFSGYVRAVGSWRASGLVGYMASGYTSVVVEDCLNLSPLIVTSSGGPYRIVAYVNDREASMTDNYSLSSSLLGTTYDAGSLYMIEESDDNYGTDDYQGANLPDDADAKSSTFYSETLGWDFTESNGIWKMLNDGYPVLQWQNTPVNSTVLNINAPDEFNILDVAIEDLTTNNKIDFSDLISSNGLTLDVSCESSKVYFSEDKIATITEGTTLTSSEDVEINITGSSDYNIDNSDVTITLAPISKIIDASKVKCYLKFDDNLDNSSSSGATFSKTSGNDITYAVGKIGDAGYFNNNAVVSSGIDLNTNEGFSLTAWISLDNLSSLLGGGQTWIHQKDVNGESVGRILLEVLDSDLLGSYTDGIRCDGTSAISTKTWYHVALVKDATNGTTTIYINDSKITSVSSGTESNTGEIVVGSRKDESSYPVQGGYMDDFLLTSEVLTAEQIHTIYQKGVEYAINTESSDSITVFGDLLDYPEGDLSSVYNCGPGMASDEKGDTDEDSKMYVISNTSLDSFTSYIQDVLANGYTEASSNTIDDNVFYTLKNNESGQLYQIYYTGSKSQVRIIQDNSSNCLTDELDVEEQGVGTTQFYIYSLDYCLGEEKSYVDYWRVNAGALMIIKLKDNSLFIIDSGHWRQSNKLAEESLLKFLYNITGKVEGSVIDIRGWFFSHAHGDHVYLAGDMMRNYHDELNVESFLYNFPSYSTISYNISITTSPFRQAINDYYPNCKYIKLHTGQEFTIQGLQFTVLYSHEDAVTADGKTRISDFNDSCDILELIMDGKKMMLLGDGNTVTQTDLLAMYSGETLKCDAVQVAHHGYNSLQGLYSAIQAPLAFWSNSKENGKDANLAKYQYVIDATDDVKTLFPYPYSYELTIVDDEFKIDSVASYRSSFMTINAIPELTVEALTSGNKVDLDNVSDKVSLEDEIIEKSVRGSATTISYDQVCSLVLDNDSTTKYCISSFPVTITWTMKEPVAIKYYEILSANDNETNTGRNPEEWELFGSNDTINWTSIDAVTGAGLPDENYVGTAFSVSNPIAYQYYALKISSTTGADILQFSEIRLYSTEDLSTAILKEESTEDVISVCNIGNKQIEVTFNGDLTDQTFISIYNISGNRVVNEQICENKTLVNLSETGTGIHLLLLDNGKRKFVKKILL